MTGFVSTMSIGQRSCVACLPGWFLWQTKARHSQESCSKYLQNEWGQPRNPVFYTVKLDPNMVWLSSALVRLWLRTDPKYKRVLTDPGLSLLWMYLSYNEKSLLTLSPSCPIWTVNFTISQHYIFKKYIQLWIWRAGCGSTHFTPSPPEAEQADLMSSRPARASIVRRCQGKE